MLFEVVLGIASNARASAVSSCPRWMNSLPVTFSSGTELVICSCNPRARGAQRPTIRAEPRVLGQTPIGGRRPRLPPPRTAHTNRDGVFTACASSAEKASRVPSQSCMGQCGLLRRRPGFQPLEASAKTTSPLTKRPPRLCLFPSGSHPADTTSLSAPPLRGSAILPKCRLTRPDNTYCSGTPSSFEPSIGNARLSCGLSGSIWSGVGNRLDRVSV